MPRESVQKTLNFDGKIAIPDSYLYNPRLLSALPLPGW